MKLKYLILLFITTLSAQEQKQPFFKNSYISAEYSYRSYGTNDHIGFGGGVEFSKDYKKWLGFGINLSYWDNEKLDWDFKDPFTGQRYQYNGRIQEYKITPFVQVIPINTQYFDFMITGGIRTGYYNQVYWLGGYSRTYNPPSLLITLQDGGNKNITLGYELGFALRFQIGHVALTPNIILISNDLNGDSFSAINFKAGWQL